MALTLTTLRNSINTEIHGRRLGLTYDDYLVGPRALKEAIEDITTTSPTTVAAFGLTRLAGLTSTQGPVQHNLPVPVPGVEKTIIMDCTSTGSQQFLSTPNGAAVLIASLGTTGNAVNFVGPGGRITLIGVSSAAWSVKNEGLYSSTALAKAVTFTTAT